MHSLANIYAEALDWMSLSDIGYLPMYDYWVADAWMSAWCKKPAPAPPSLTTVHATSLERMYRLGRLGVLNYPLGTVEWWMGKAITQDVFGTRR